MIDLLEPKYNISFKIIGIFCMIMAGIIYGEYQYTQGSLDTCIDSGGYLIANGTISKCLNSSELLQRGFILDKEHKVLIKQAYASFNYSFIDPND